jgi:hypothetical protein
MGDVEPHLYPKRMLNRTPIPFLNMKLGLLAQCALALLLCSCAATSVKKTWKAPGYDGPVGKMAVLTIEERGDLRQGFENRFVAQLTKRGSAAVPTFDLLSLLEIKQDKPAATERLRAKGAEAILILRLLDRTTSFREVQPTRDADAPAMGFATLGWYDYYDVGFRSMNTPSSTLKENVYLETSLYDLKTQKALWSALTRTVIKEDMDRVAEMTPLVEKIVAAMKKDGVIR